MLPGSMTLIGFFVLHPFALIERRDKVFHVRRDGVECGGKQIASFLKVNLPDWFMMRYSVSKRADLIASREKCLPVSARLKFMVQVWHPGSFL